MRKKQKKITYITIFLFNLFLGWLFLNTSNIVQAGCCTLPDGSQRESNSATGCSGTYTENDCSVNSNTGSNGGGNMIHFPNPLAYNTVDELVTSVLDALQGVIVVISLIFIVVGAILYITSSGDENRITMARKAIAASVIGLAIGIAAPSFLHEIAIILQWQSEPETTSGALTIAQIALNTLNFLLSIVGVLAIIMLVVAGIMYLTAAGDEQRIDTAKSMTKWAIIGIGIALGSLVIVHQIARFFTSTPAPPH